MQAHRREFLGRLAEEAGQLVDAEGRHRAGRVELAAQLVEIGLLAADPERNGDRHGQQARILRAEEDVEKARPGVGGQQDPLARAEARTDELARHDMGAFARLAPRECGREVAPGAVERRAGHAAGSIVHRLRHRAEAGAAQGQAGVMGGKRGHPKAGSPSRATPPPQGWRRKAVSSPHAPRQ